MAKKDVTGRLCFEKDFFEASGSNISQDSASDDTNTKLEESSGTIGLRLEDLEPWLKEDIDE